jgi:RHS repeat-associated protein
LVEVKNSGGTTIQTYSYDALGRRITENPGTIRHFYFSAAGQVLEERVGSSTNANVQYVWCPCYVDAMIERDRDTTGNGTLDERLYVAQDVNYNVTSVFDTSGTVQERFVQEPFGLVTVYDATWNVRSSSSVAWVYNFQGKRFDAVVGLYWFNRRFYSPTLQVFVSQDPIFATNLYLAEGDDPPNRVDPSGMDWLENVGNKLANAVSSTLIDSPVGDKVVDPSVGKLTPLGQLLLPPAWAGAYEYARQDVIMGANAGLAAGQQLKEMETRVQAEDEQGAITSWSVFVASTFLKTTEMGPEGMAVNTFATYVTKWTTGKTAREWLVEVNPAAAQRGEFVGEATYEMANLLATAISIFIGVGEVKAGCSIVQGSGRAYSVAYETRLRPTTAPIGTRYAHSAEANANLFRAMDTHPDFRANIRTLIPDIENVRGTGLTPEHWTWNHNAFQPGVMELVPKIQHWAPNPLYGLFHPVINGQSVGGFKLWGRLF